MVLPADLAAFAKLPPADGGAKVRTLCRFVWKNLDWLHFCESHGQPHALTRLMRQRLCIPSRVSHLTPASGGDARTWSWRFSSSFYHVAVRLPAIQYACPMQVVCVNPGRLAKGVTGGSWAHLQLRVCVEFH